MTRTGVLLIRHAQTGALGATLTGRAPGTPLSPEGAESAARLARHIAREPLTRLLTSPSLRARQTADHIAQATGCTAEDEPALNEIDFGTWTAQSFEILATDNAWRSWNQLRSLAPTPGGETMLQAQARAVALLQSLHAQQQDATYALVTHADIIKAILCYTLGSPIDLMHRIEITPASISRITLYERDLHIDTINYRT